MRQARVRAGLVKRACRVSHPNLPAPVAAEIAPGAASPWGLVGGGQHSVGSGRSNSIAWLSHQLLASMKESSEIFDTVIVVADRRILDDQIQKTVKQFMQFGATVGHAEHSGDLRKFIQEGKKIIITTVQKFPFILAEIEKDAAGRKFAIIIDEAHSSQGGKASAAMSAALSDLEDICAASSAPAWCRTQGESARHCNSWLRSPSGRPEAIKCGGAMPVPPTQHHPHASSHVMKYILRIW